MGPPYYDGPHTHSFMTTGDFEPSRDQELLTVQATLRRLQLTPEEAIKIVSAHIQEAKESGQV